MLDKNVLRGAFLAAVALAFGIGALRYPLGDLARAGPGLFPVMVSGLLLGLAVVSVVQSRLATPVPIDVQLRNIGFVLGGLAAFVVASKLLNMAVGIVALVVIASFAGRSPSWRRSLEVSIGLLVVAYGFQRLLGLNLRLFG